MNGANHSPANGYPNATSSAATSRMSAATKCGSSQRSCSAVPQRISLPSIGLLPEARDQRAQQQHLHRAHPRVRRHFEGAEFEQSEPARGGVRRIQLVDRKFGAMRVAGQVGQQVAQQPIRQPGRRLGLAAAVLARQLLERDLQLVQAIVARFVHARRLAGRSDEGPRKQVRQRRVVLPVRHQASQQVGPAQQRAVGGRRAAERDVVAASGSGMAAVEHEFFGAQSRLPRFLVERRHRGHQFAPRRCRLDVDFDHARIGRDVEHAERADRAAACSLRWPPADAVRARCPRSPPAARRSPRCVAPAA